ncbi:glycosyltransferase family 2 protein [Mesorhizobium sp. M0118]|uniref:glycosyltransferase family 2 protein n=1 Tax=Mesorhizobium sp. M0118 TaxID=2956884 RepID=UPI003335E17C
MNFGATNAGVHGVWAPACCHPTMSIEASAHRQHLESSPAGTPQLLAICLTVLHVEINSKQRIRASSSRAVTAMRGIDGLSKATWPAIVRRTITDTAIYRLRHTFGRRAEVSSLRPITPLKANDLPLILVIRNEADRLHPFLKHYRELGVTRFAVLDDRSTDGTAELLAEQPDVDLFSSPITYSQSDLGNLWRQRIVQIYGQPRWYLTVDADEYLVYDGMDQHPLGAMADWLKRRGMTRLLAPMIDMYPSGNIWDVPFDPIVPPWQVADHFDVSGYEMTRSPRHLKITGGPRTRLFARQHKLTKFPLIYVDRQTIFTSIHSPLPYWRNYIKGLAGLLHFKFFADFNDKAQVAVAEGQYWNGASKYRQYHEVSSGKAALSAMSEQSMLYEGAHSLFKTGLIDKIDW